jgi:hypothetical protein
MKTKLKVIETKKVILKNAIGVENDSKIFKQLKKARNGLNFDSNDDPNKLDHFDDNFNIGDGDDIKLDDKRSLTFIDLIKIDDSSEVFIGMVDDKRYLFSDNRESVEKLVNDYKIFGKIEDEIIVS